MDKLKEQLAYTTENHVLTKMLEYALENGKEVKLINGYFEIVEKSNDTINNELRATRDYECFSIINRGKLWYEFLTDKQIDELRDWYTAWLDVTKTRIIPAKPEWL